MTDVQKELELLLDQEESNLTVIGRHRLSELINETNQTEEE